MHRFRSVVVITSALHAEGPGFEPQRNQLLIERLYIFCLTTAESKVKIYPVKCVLLPTLPPSPPSGGSRATVHVRSKAVTAAVTS